jgi:hypothetical protein
MFRVVVNQWLAVRDALGWLTREVQLPLAPFPGLHLNGIRHDEEAFRVAEVAWDVTGQRFLVFLDKNVDQEKTLANVRAFYGTGWTFTPAEPPRAEQPPQALRA